VDLPAWILTNNGGSQEEVERQHLDHMVAIFMKRLAGGVANLLVMSTVLNSIHAYEDREAGQDGKKMRIMILAGALAAEAHQVEAEGIYPVAVGVVMEEAGRLPPHGVVLRVVAKVAAQVAAILVEEGLERCLVKKQEELQAKVAEQDGEKTKIAAGAVEPTEVEADKIFRSARGG